MFYSSEKVGASSSRFVRFDRLRCRVGCYALESHDFCPFMLLPSVATLSAASAANEEALTGGGTCCPRCDATFLLGKLSCALLFIFEMMMSTRAEPTHTLYALTHTPASAFLSLDSILFSSSISDGRECHVSVSF